MTIAAPSYFHVSRAVPQGIGEGGTCGAESAQAGTPLIVMGITLPAHSVGTASWVGSHSSTLEEGTVREIQNRGIAGNDEAGWVRTSHINQ